MLSYSQEDSKERYLIKQDDEIVLYGYNLYCREQVDRLLEGGYRVAGIIDKNAQDGDEYRGIEMTQSIENFPVSEKTCVFIMLQNGMLHWEIARDLYRHGVTRVVFLPMKTGFYSDGVQNEFILQYNYLMEGCYSSMKPLYLQNEMFELNVGRQWKLARQLDNVEYIIWISRDLLRTTMKEEEKYRDIPIADFTPYMNLFSYLAGDQRDITEYIKLYGLAPFPETSAEARDYVIKKRRELYAFFEDKFSSGDMDYFVAAAPKAVWNAHGYLNLCEGQHRCVYLLAKGIKYLPVRVDQMVIDRMKQKNG